MKAVFTGGGTGGHVYPGIAVAEELRRRRQDAEIVFMGTREGVEARVVPRYGFQLKLIAAQGLMGRGPFRAMVALPALAIGFFQSLFFLARFRPDVILATGGFVSAPVGLAATLLKIPLVLQEQNSIPGATNRILANFAAEVHLNFAASRKHLRRKDNLRLTGNPVRSTVGAGNRTLALEHFGLDLTKRTVFVFGGSRGAHAINEAAVGAIRELGGRQDVQFIVQTGKRDHAEVKSALEGARIPVAARPYLMRIEEAYAAADLIVCRSGAMTLSEVMACGLPAILVPFPHAAQGHQVANAREMVEAGAAEMILDSELTGPRLARTIASLLDDPRRQREMSANAYRMARIDATAKLASALEALADRRSEAAAAAEEPAAPPSVPPPTRPAPPPRSGDRSRRRGGRGRGGRRGPNPNAAGGAPRGGPQPKDRGPRTANARDSGTSRSASVAGGSDSRAALGQDGSAR